MKSALVPIRESAMSMIDTEALKHGKNAKFAFVSTNLGGLVGSFI